MNPLTVTKLGSRKAFRRRVHEEGAQCAFNWLRHVGTNYAEPGAALRKQNGANCALYRLTAKAVIKLALDWAGDMRGVKAEIEAFQATHGLYGL